MSQNEINRGGLNRTLTRTLTIKGDVPPAPLIGAEIVPTLPLEVDRPEWGFLSGERAGLAEASLINVAGQRCKACIENPLNSGVIAVVNRLNCYTGNPAPGPLSALVRYADPTEDATSFLGGAPANDLPGAIRDYRWSDVSAGSFNTNACAVRLKTNTSGIGMGGFFIGDVCSPLFEQVSFIPERVPWIILPPGWKLGVDGSVNQSLCALFCWYERALEPSEFPPRAR